MPTAKANLDHWAASHRSVGEFIVRYRFLLTEEFRTTEKVILIGTSFDRFFRRIVRKPTSEKIIVCEEIEESPLSFRQRSSIDGPLLEIDIAAGAACLNKKVTATF